MITRKSTISLKYCALILALGTLPFSVCCTRTSVNGKSNANQNIKVAPNNNNAETANQHLSSAATSSPGINQSSSTPDALVREFYAWYLSEFRVGKKPFEEEERMKQYVTDDFFAEIRKRVDDDPRFDPTLLLPNSDLSWHNMKVQVSKANFFGGKAHYDAYVYVTYKTADGKDYDDENSVGLQRAGAGWKIASIGLKD